MSEMTPMSEAQMLVLDHHLEQFGDVPLVEAALKLGEEAGEVQKAVHRFLEGRGDITDIRAEAGDLLVTLDVLLGKLGYATSGTQASARTAFLFRTWPDAVKYEDRT